MWQPRARRKARFDGIIIRITVWCKESSGSESFPVPRVFLESSIQRLA